MSLHSSAVLSLFLLTSNCRCENRKTIKTMTVSDLVPGGVARVRAGCESLFPIPSEVEKCVRTTLNSAVIAQLCSRAQFDGGDFACASLMKLSGDSLVLETTNSIFLVVDGARVLSW